MPAPSESGVGEQLACSLRRAETSSAPTPEGGDKLRPYSGGGGKLRPYSRAPDCATIAPNRGRSPNLAAPAVNTLTLLVLLYVVLQLALGAWIGRRTKTAEDYRLGGRSLG